MLTRVTKATLDVLRVLAAADTPLGGLQVIYGDRLAIERAHDPFVEMSPGRGRMPLAQDVPQ